MILERALRLESEDCREGRNDVLKRLSSSSAFVPCLLREESVLQTGRAIMHCGHDTTVSKHYISKTKAGNSDDVPDDEQQ